MLRLVQVHFTLFKIKTASAEAMNGFDRKGLDLEKMTLI